MWKLGFHEHSQCTSTKGKKSLYDILSKYKKIGGMSFNLYSQLYHTCVESVTDYASGVWGLYAKNNDSVMHTAIRLFLGLPRRCALAALEHEVKWMNCEHRNMSLRYIYIYIYTFNMSLRVTGAAHHFA